MECNDCGCEFVFHKGIETGELITCSDCAKEYEVIRINPVLLQEAPEVEEDWGE
ncbi:lysine biosynthesis protein LysW [archaeon]|jgi:alpha-aminoadipate/glutamate carrier protein LysW|nr:lysine biosynthesis protein LysW [archaeon]MBT4352231.1 lysine biosynthesis protein LysW [archaeon]MBT4647354.1 lysine biosynthesis protein LysW [archaeon]MBT6821210.1 lysine biosynthesis protein LysW [archaeon]MBT7391262.1 lysine biosynthesis protein LysW [archaeon]